MFQTLSESWRISKTAFRMIKEDKALLLFPVVSALALIGIVILLAVSSFLVIFSSIQSGTDKDALIAIIWITGYFMLWFVHTFFSAALINASMIKLNGQQASFSDGIEGAKSQWKKIFLWAIFAGTVGIIINIIASKLKGFGKLILSIAAGAVWGIATYFILPVLLYENLSAWQSLKRSASIYWNNFGNTFISNMIVNAIIIGGVLGGIVMVVAGIFITAHTFLLGIVLILAGVVLAAISVLIGSAVNGVLIAALYKYATTGKLEEGLVPSHYVGKANPYIGQGPYVGQGPTF
ncbi:MAG: DUF6159 family protein [Thermoplasmata archaeon]